MLKVQIFTTSCAPLTLLLIVITGNIGSYTRVPLYALRLFLGGRLPSIYSSVGWSLASVTFQQHLSAKEAGR